MGIITEIGAGVGAALAAEEIWSKLNEDRTCMLELENQTEHVLRLDGSGHAHGGFAELPSDSVPGRSIDHFGSQSSDGSIFTGTEGYARYSIGSARASLTIRWNNPFIGGNSCSGSSEGERGAAFEVVSLSGAGNDAHMRYILRQVREPSLVRPPDYGWVRLEGYALDPRHNWWPNGPDDPPMFPDGASVVELHSWYSKGRGDNWASAHPSKTRPLMEAISPDYHHYRFEGYIFSPTKPAPQGTVPLHSWYSRSRGDNWHSTNPRFTNPLRARLEPDYGHYNLEGFLYSPARPQPANTVPVHSWYSRSRGDNFMTTDPRYYP